MIKTAIIGGADYTAGELIRLLVNHPDVEMMWVHSPADAGKLLSDVHQGLLGETFMRFTDSIDWDGVNVAFLCSSRGDSQSVLAESNVPSTVKIIDMAVDHRIQAPDHDFIYGLPELNRKALVRGAHHVANPGHFATAISLSLLPLAKAQLLNGDICATAICGSTGADADAAPALRYSRRNNNVSVISPLSHRHVPEVVQTLRTLQPDFSGRIDFIPLMGSFARGILSVVHLPMPEGLSLPQVRELFEEFYSDHSFVSVANRPVDLKDVVNTNKCAIFIEQADQRLVITAVIDNLLKGASGNAIHIMNLLYGLHERVGLILKPSAF